MCLKRKTIDDSKVCIKIHIDTNKQVSIKSCRMCVTKNLGQLQTAITPFRIVRIAKFGGVLKRAQADLSSEYNNFSGTQLGAEIFKFKVDPGTKTQIKNREYGYFRVASENIEYLLKPDLFGLKVNCSWLRSVWGSLFSISLV